ncbi:hypothetical protein [Faecalicatena orotica]|uniref:hypothetical protein n=1 Tax=Faecalicatena orotica TaxID=1544 RepID=UPI003216F610
MDKKKKLAVRILAGFFIAMAVCTIIARAAASLMVAQVNVDKVRRGRLTYSYTGSGKIVPEKEEQIFLWPGQQVEKAAKEGSTVKRGECLVQFRGEYLLKTIEQKQSEVEQLKLRREQQLISTRETQRVPASASAALALKSAEDRLAQAWQKEADAQYAYDSEESEELKQQLYQEVQSTQAEAASLEQAVTDAQNAYDLACQQDAAQEENDANAREAAELGIKDLDIQIRQAEEELKKLQEYQAADGKIYAEKTCVILKSGVQEGSISTGTEVLTVGNSGWRLQGTAGTEEKEVLEAGLQVEIETSSSEKYKVEIESVAQDRDGENTGILSGQTGNADAGGDPAAEVTFWSASLPDGMVAAYNETFIWKTEIETEEEFDQIIPQSALREGASGYYCLVLSEETGMLGTVQAAKKVNVNVIKKDGEKAAVEGGLKRDSQIIVSSDKYVEEGDQVRIKENEN